MPTVKYAPFMVSPPIHGGVSGPLADMTNANGDGGLIWSASTVHRPMAGADGQYMPVGECFSRKVFIGGLPPDIDEGGLISL